MEDCWDLAYICIHTEEEEAISSITYCAHSDPIGLLKHFNFCVSFIVVNSADAAAAEEAAALDYAFTIYLFNAYTLFYFLLFFILFSS